MAEESNLASRRPMTAAIVYQRRMEREMMDEGGEQEVLNFAREDNNIGSGKVTIHVGTTMRRAPGFVMSRGELEETEVCVRQTPVTKQRALERLREGVLGGGGGRRRMEDLLGAHPRLCRHLGAGFDMEARRVYLVSDYMAGCSYRVRLL